MSKKDEKLIAYCGLFCGECFGYEQKIHNLARDLRKELRKKNYDKFASFMAKSGFGKKFINYDKCYEVLGEMIKFRCHKGCRDGGGNPFCGIRKCCQKKGFDGCWQCEEFTKCKKLDILKDVHGNAHIKNLKRIKKDGKTKFIKSKKDF